MSSPSMVQRSGDTLLVRSVVSGDSLYEESEDDIDLPQCKIKRNYTCTHCTYYTQNPRSYLYHLKDEHGEKIKVYECPSCLYASKHSQKLQRHVHMVHVIGRGAAAGFKKKKSEVTKSKLWNSASAGATKQVEKSGNDSKAVNMSENIVLKMSGGEVRGCSLCPFTSSDPSEALKHERTAHLKKKFYRCSKCNYVTHMKARYTKHVKYHSMPMIKCDLCDFRTPYKWNLDRHYKNHTGDGAYRCALCNFTADIKQSLTVHEMNHHVPPVGQPASAGSGAGTTRRRNKVGASDSAAVEEEIDQEELELLRMEREDAADSAPPYQAQSIKPAISAASTASSVNIINKSRATPGSINIISSNGNIRRTNTITASAGNTKRTPKIKVTLKKLKTPSSQEQNERHNFQTDFIHPDDIIHHKNGNVYIKNLKCRMCNYKAAWEGEMARHESKAHGIHRPISVKQATKKVPRPIPNLIPIQNKVMPPGSVTSLPILRIPTIRGRAATSLLKPQQLQTSQQESGLSERDLNEICAKSCPNSSLKDFASLIGGEDAFKLPDDELNDGAPKKTSPKQEEEDYYDEDEVALSDSQSQSKPNILSSITESSFKKKNASFFDKLKEKLLVGAGESCNLVCTCCGHESKCLSELARHQKLHSSPGNRSSDGSGTNGGSGVVLASGAELSSTRCQHCRQRCKTSADLLIHLQSCSEANKNLAASSPSPAPITEIPDAKEEKVQDVEDEEEEEGECEEEEEEEEEKIREEEPHPMENKVFVWNNLPQPVETESEEDHQPQCQAQQEEQQQQQQQEQLQQQKQAPPLQQQDDDSLDTSVRSKSPISEGSLVGIETAPGYGAVTSKILSDSPDGPLLDS